MTFKELASYHNSLQAELLVNILRENGIPAFTNAGESNVALSYIQSGMRMISVFVAPEQFQDAQRLLDQLFDDSGQPWYCGKCETEIEAGFDVCWSCGLPREEVEAPFPERKVNAHESISSPMFNAQADASNPYSAPVAPVSITPDSPQTAEQIRADDLINRAWTASILGMVFLPLVLQFYSMYLLIQAGTIDAPLSDQSQKRYNRAIVLNIIGIILGALFVRMVLI